jgi:DNA-binding transcriptional ArsR family regulator
MISIFRCSSKCALTFDIHWGIIIIEQLEKYLNEGGKDMGLRDSLKALSDPTRQEILQLLKDGRRSAGDIGAHFDMTGATISHHLSILKQAGLIEDFREGKYIYYELNMTVMEELMGWFLQFKK